MQKVPLTFVQPKKKSFKYKMGVLNIKSTFKCNILITFDKTQCCSNIRITKNKHSKYI